MALTPNAPAPPSASAGAPAGAQAPRESSWAPHHGLLRDLEERCRLHPEITGVTIEIVTGPGAGLRDLRVLVREDHKQLARAR